MTPPRIRWRRWNNVLHRDLGYVAVGLTLVYAISGLAVNHTHDWNPSYSFNAQDERFEPFPISDKATMVDTLVRRLDLPGPPRDSFRPSPREVQLFYDGWSVDADVLAGTAVVERPRQRVVLRALNELHLNHARGAWTFIADAYAGVLLFLAVSGIFVLKGRNGLAGRGKWLVGAGVGLPLLAIAVIRLLG